MLRKSHVAIDPITDPSGIRDRTTAWYRRGVRQASTWIAVAVFALPIDAAAADRVPLGTGGRAGVGLVIGGAVALVGGAVLVGVHEEPHLDPHDSQREIARLTRGPGIALLVLGTAVAAGGAALLAIDRKRARVRVAPWLGARGGGLVFALRFGGRA
ncbi:MAG TPA: hypothetical protein VG755_07620 [Nannocystaceae bacterium]|nr:hypothetical protein [Nannocystaceae bacterium]